MKIEEAIALANQCGHANKRVGKLPDTSSDGISSGVAVLMKQFDAATKTTEIMAKKLQVLRNQIALIKADMACRSPARKQSSITADDQANSEMPK